MPILSYGIDYLDGNRNSFPDILTGWTKVYLNNYSDAVCSIVIESSEKLITTSDEVHVPRVDIYDRRNFPDKTWNWMGRILEMMDCKGQPKGFGYPKMQMSFTWNYSYVNIADRKGTEE